MSKKIEVIIKATNAKVGKRGDIVKVSQGYALNYLIPQQIAEIATKGKLKHLRMIQNIKSSQLETLYSKASILKINWGKIIKVSLKKTTGEKKQIFGSINEKEILTQIYNYTGEKIEKKQIFLPEIKKIGTYNIKIQIFHDLFVNLKLQILPYTKYS